MGSILRGGLAILVAVVAVGAVYELAVALGVIGLGPHPGDPPAGYNRVVGITLLALALMGAVLVLAALPWRGGDACGRVAAPLAGAVAAAFLVARFYSYDPYYAPDLHRMSDGGIVAGSWVAFLIIVTFAAALLVRWSPRVALAATAVAVWANALTAAVAGTGH
jgi:hypothetical protein